MEPKEANNDKNITTKNSKNGITDNRNSRNYNYKNGNNNNAKYTNMKRQNTRTTTTGFRRQPIQTNATTTNNN
jgi:hypothetical protein